MISDKEKLDLIQKNYSDLVLKYNILDKNYKELCKEALQTNALDEMQKVTEKEYYQQPAQEPVLYIDQSGLDGHATWAQAIACQDTDIPLYAHPPKQWQGLTDDEIQAIRIKTFDAVATNYEAYRAIEAKLKEKNT